MERKTRTLNFATKATKVKIVFKVLKPKKEILPFLGVLGPWWLFRVLALLCFLSSSAALC